MSVTMGGNVGHQGGRRSRTTAIPRGYDASSSPIEPYRVLSPCGGGPEGRPATGSNVLQVTVDPLPVGRYAVGRRRVSNVPRTPPAMGGDPGKVATRHRPHIYQSSSPVWGRNVRGQPARYPLPPRRARTPEIRTEMVVRHCATRSQTCPTTPVVRSLVQRTPLPCRCPTLCRPLAKSYGTHSPTRHRS